jgi:tRNA pseudouridine38-40 synthase
MSAGRVVLGIGYDGRGYAGWQRQDHARSVQQAVEEALATVADHPVRVTAAGRTDAGVHATAQVVHFDTTAERTPRAWVLGANSNLPGDVAVRWARPVAAGFDARRSAVSRSYLYLIANVDTRPALALGRATWERRPLDDAAMHAAAQALVGEHDFSAFRASACQSRSPWRRLSHIAVHRHGELLAVEVRANAFLHHMVRNVVGALIDVGCGDRPAGWLATLLAGGDRKAGSATAAADGLYLVDVEYPAVHDLPRGTWPLLAPPALPPARRDDYPRTP